MKLIKKLNRGAVVSFIAIVGVIIYLLVHNIVQNSEKPQIKKVAESYINTYVKYNMLPENFRTQVSKMTKKEFDDYIVKMESDIKSFYPANDDGGKYAADMIKNSLESQMSQNNVIYSYEKEITRLKYKFEDSTVTVTVNTNSKFDGPDIANPSAGRSKLNAVTSDVIILKKISGDWKVIYSDIENPSKANSLGGGFRIQKEIE